MQDLKQIILPSYRFINQIYASEKLKLYGSTSDLRVKAWHSLLDSTETASAYCSMAIPKDINHRTLTK